MTCSVSGCDRTIHARGWCKGHYQRWYQTGSVGSATFTVLYTGAAKEARDVAVIKAGAKACRRCCQMKPLDAFSAHRRGVAGRNTDCRSCVVDRARESQERRGTATVRAYQREYAKRPGARSADVARTQKRRAKMRLAFVEPVDRMKVYWSHLGKCGICGETVPLDDFHVDHIVPLARGGEHSYANTQPAHPVCNLRKGARADTEVAP